MAGDVLIELCMNAVKHGKATQVTIRGGVTSERLCELSVSDNGQYPNLDTPHAGGGTQLLEQACVRWERVTSADGTRVSVWLPRLVDDLSVGGART